MAYPLGTILLSRWHDERENSSPGFWNHSVIYVGNERIVESQRTKGVIVSRLDEYQARGMDWCALIPKDAEVGRAAAITALGLVGADYRQFSSIRRDGGSIRRGLNCVSAAFKIPYGQALGRPFVDIRTPDDILNKTCGVFES